jgi:nitric oxide reductase NorD protein
VGIEEIVDALEPLTEQQRADLLDNVPSIWPISHTLCYSYLSLGAGQIAILPRSLMKEWVRQILDHYESGGLRQAQAFMANVQERFIHKFESNSEVFLQMFSGH